MKTLKTILLGALVLFAGMSFQSCLDDDDSTNLSLLQPNALVTVKPVEGNSFFLQLDDSTTLLPTNMATSPFGDKEMRALINFSEVKQPAEGYDMAVHINWIDSILTKTTAPDLGEKNDEIYGTDPVEIVNDWVTIAEDGYLTLRFRTIWGDSSKAHYVNLLTGQNPENPYEVEFRHNAHGDVYGQQSDGLVAFKLDSLPDTEGKTVKLKLKWKSFNGDKSAEFNFSSRQSTPVHASMVAERSVLKLK